MSCLLKYNYYNYQQLSLFVSADTGASPKTDIGFIFLLSTLYLIMDEYHHFPSMSYYLGFREKKA
jgi:hypothetical protein